jgi:hypothetical protein
LIGVIAKDGQARVVEEFFELFKTPWELYRSDQVYDVVIATCDEIPEVNTKLLLVYGSARKDIDVRYEINTRGRQQRVKVSERDTFPIYGELLTFANGSNGIPCVTMGSEIAGLRVASPSSTVIRLGYDLFAEVELLLSTGQPVENAHIPTLDIHIRMLRNWILSEGIPLLEIPPAPAGHSFVVCLTHDIDFVGVRNHKFDHSMWGFVYRATLGSLHSLFRGRISVGQVFKNWGAVASLPFVYAGWAKDFWEPFEWYLKIEKDLPATYFLIPFKRRVGDNVPGTRAFLRAAAYDVCDLPQWTAVLLSRGCEVGVHGIDAWHNVDKGRDELARVTAATGESSAGIRIHWLLSDASTPSVLDQAGYAYDSTFGYNETIGYYAGTSQVFRPLSAQTLLELPMHVQDGALFFRGRLDLSDLEAEKRCQTLIDHARKFGGVLTLLWHDRSHGPERFWGEFYAKLLRTLKSLDGWFGSAAQVVSWFRKRREVRFEQVATPSGSRTVLRYDGKEIQPPLLIRAYRPERRRSDCRSVGNAPVEFRDFPWNGRSVDELNLQIASLSVTAPDIAVCSPS